MTGADTMIIDVDRLSLATAMVEKFGDDAEAEIERRATACKSRGEQAACEAWWRVAALIPQIRGTVSEGPVN